MSGQHLPGGTGYPAHHDPAGVSVIGRGRASTVADTVTIHLVVTITRLGAGDAFRDASTAVTAVLGILADHGADSRSVKTQQISLGPRHDYGGEGRRFIGYDATQRLEVTLDGLATVGTLLTDLGARVTEGLQITDLTVTAANPREAESTARTAAMIDAREKATSLAALAGRPLGAVVDVSEVGDGDDTRIALMAADTGPHQDMPVSAGDTAVNVSVWVRFAWAD